MEQFVGEDLAYDFNNLIDKDEFKKKQIKDMKQKKIPLKYYRLYAESNLIWFSFFYFLNLEDKMKNPKILIDSLDELCISGKVEKSRVENFLYHYRKYFKVLFKYDDF